MTDSTPPTVIPSRRSWVLAAVAVGMGALLVLSESCECVEAAVVLVAALQAASSEILRSFVLHCSVGRQVHELHASTVFGRGQ